MNQNIQNLVLRMHYACVLTRSSTSDSGPLFTITGMLAVVRILVHGIFSGMLITVTTPIGVVESLYPQISQGLLTITPGCHSRSRWNGVPGKPSPLQWWKIRRTHFPMVWRHGRVHWRHLPFQMMLHPCIGQWNGTSCKLRWGICRSLLIMSYPYIGQW